MTTPQNDTEFAARYHFSSARKILWSSLASVAALPTILLLAWTTYSLANQYLPDDSVTATRITDLALNNQTKTGDYLFSIVVFFLIAVFWIVHYTFTRFWDKKLNKTLVLALFTVSAAQLSSMTLNQTESLSSGFDSVFGTLFTVHLAQILAWSAITYYAKRCPNFSERLQVKAQVISALFAVFFWGTTVSLRIVLEQLGIDLPWVWAINAGVHVVLIVLWVKLLADISSVESQNSYLAVTVAVIGATALFVFVPPLTVDETGTISTSPGVPMSRWAAVVALYSLAIATELALRWRRTTGLLRKIPSLSIAPLATIPLITFTAPAINSDDYHFGEMLSPYFLWRDSGQIPYIDQFLPRGILNNVAPQFINDVVNNGESSTYVYASALLFMIVVAISHLLLRFAVGLPLSTIAITALVLTKTFESDVFVLSLMVWLIWVILKNSRPVLTGIAFSCANLIALLAYPMMGILSVAVTSLVAVAAVIGAVIGKKSSEVKNSLIALISAISVVIIIVVISPIRDLLIGAISYVIVNASSNSEAFGKSILELLNTNLGWGHVLGQAFILAIPVSFALFWLNRKRLVTPSWNNYALLALTLIPATATVIMIGRFLGRIDYSEWSYRMSVGTVTLLCLIVPVVFWLLGRERAALWISAITIFVVAIPAGGISTSQLIAGVTAPKQASVTWTSEDADAELSNLGLAHGDPEHFSELLRTAAVASELPKGTPVLNLANRGTYYAYFDWDNPMKVLSPYNIESEEHERELIRSLSQEQPQYVFLGPSDQGIFNAALRNPTLTSWVVKNYTMLDCGTEYWATADGRPGDLTNCKPAPSHQEQLELWAQSNAAADLDVASAPAYWGRLLDGYEVVQDVQLISSDRFRTDEQETIVGVNLQHDFTPRTGKTIHASITCVDGAVSHNVENKTARATLVWTGDAEGETFAANFIVEATEMHFPLDIYPQWLLSDSTDSKIDIILPTSDCSGDWSAEVGFAEKPA